MSTISYKCATCKREVELLENQKGLTIIGRCILTDGCSGKMQTIERNPYNVRESYEYFDTDYLENNSRNKFFKHIQKNVNTVWRITHNLNNHPFVVVYLNTVNGVEKIDNSAYQVEYYDANTLLITGISGSGVAHCTARTSNRDSVIAATDINTSFQVTVGGTFTFAIPKYLTKLEGTPTVTPTPTVPLDLFDIGTIKIEIGITRPNEDEVVCFEKIPVDQTSSSWLGTNEIMIRNRRNYYVKMKNILNFTTFDNASLTFADIPNGTKIRFLKIDYGTGIQQDIPSRGAFLLLSKYPFKIADKVVNKVIDLGEIIESPYWYMTYQDGEVFISTDAIENTYPDIRKVA